MRILFSPVGTTDPVRNCRDGACLHILRHYHPDQVVLYYTAEMEEREKKTHMYTLGVEHVQTGCPVQEICSGITNAHLYDAYLHHLPQSVFDVHRKYPGAEILLNLSSGTPQIKVILAIMATEYDWCRGIQVASPEKRSNVHAVPVQDTEDIEELLVCNEDDEIEAENRCSEPHLEVLRLYREKYELMSLVNQYEYTGAWAFCKGNPGIPDGTKKLIHFAMFRADLQTKAAQQIMRKYQGQQLFPMDKDAEMLTEYLLTMQIHQEKSQYANLMVQLSPFLYELFLAYLKMNITIPILSYREKIGGKRILRRETLLHKPLGTELVSFLDEKFGSPYRDGELSFILLYQIFAFAEQKDAVVNLERHTDFMKNSLINHIDNIRKLRNNAAHEIVNVTKETVMKRTGMNPSEIIQSCWQLLSLTYGPEINRQRMAYKNINQWIEDTLKP